MGEETPEPDEATSALPGREPATQPTPVQPGYQPTYIPTRRPEGETAPPAPDPGREAPTVIRRQPTEVVGPGDPATYRSAPDVAPPAPGPPLEYAPGPPPQYAPGPPPQYAPGPAAGAAGRPPGGYGPGGTGPGGPAAAGPGGARDVLRYGPGVPESGAGVAAESVWRTGQRPGPPSRQGRLRRMRRVLGSALTVILLVAAGVVVWLRFFHHSPFHVTGVSISQETKTSCGMNVTGRIATNGSAGTVSYQWVFKPQIQAPQPLSQSVTAGQHDVFVTVAVQGQGHGTATQEVTLDVLSPDPRTKTVDVRISC
jgi:hypothetical protein